LPPVPFTSAGAPVPKIACSVSPPRSSADTRKDAPWPPVALTPEPPPPPPPVTLSVARQPPGGAAYSVPLASGSGGEKVPFGSCGTQASSAAEPAAPAAPGAAAPPLKATALASAAVGATKELPPPPPPARGLSRL